MPRRESYQIIDQSGCKIIKGTIALREIANVMLELSKSQTSDAIEEQWILDNRIAMHLNVVMVCGPRNATKLLRKELGIP